MLWSCVKGRQYLPNLQCGLVIQKGQRELKQEGVQCALEQHSKMNGVRIWAASTIISSYRLIAPGAHTGQELIRAASVSTRCSTRQLTSEQVAKCYQQNCQNIVILAVCVTMT